MRNRLQWGPVLGGIVTGLATMLVLTALGLAIGASAYKPGNSLTDWGSWAGVYGIASALVAFFVGGWVAASASDTGGTFSALVNGFVTGAGMLLILVWMTTTGLTNLVGYVGSNLANVTGVTTGNVQSAADTATANLPGVTYSDVETGAWITFVVLVAVLAAAAIGGWAGSHSRADVVDPAR